MKPEYRAWIDAYVKANDDFVRGKCEDGTKEMLAAFPELRLAVGFVHCTWGRDQHFWCVTEDGEIIDPTRSQFIAVWKYEELDLADPATRAKIPTGRCMDCGDDVYGGNQFCSDKCWESTRVYLESF